MFSIKINKIGTDKRAYPIIKNTIRRIDSSSCWFICSITQPIDCLDDDLLPRSTLAIHPHDGRADNAAYRHDRRADKRRYPHDREIDIQMLKMFRNGYILS